MFGQYENPLKSQFEKGSVEHRLAVKASKDHGRRYSSEEIGNGLVPTSRPAREISVPISEGSPLHAKNIAAAEAQRQEQRRKSRSFPGLVKALLGWFQS